MGCFSGRLMSTANDQKLFCKLCSPFCCSFDEFVEEKVISPSYSSAILTPPPESPLDCKEIQPVHPKGNQSWIFLGRTDARAETPILWPSDVKKWLIGKDPDAEIGGWRQEEKGTTEGEMIGWHYQLNELEFEQALEAGDGQGGMVCCSPFGQSQTWLSNWTEPQIKPTSIGLGVHSKKENTTIMFVQRKWEKNKGSESGVQEYRVFLVFFLEFIFESNFGIMEIRLKLMLKWLKV